MKIKIFFLLLLIMSFNLYGLEMKKVYQLPLVPREGDNVEIVANINSQENIKILKLFYSINGSVYTTITSDSNRTDRYYFHIPKILDSGDFVSYYIYAENMSSDIVVSDTYRFTVGQISILFDYTKEETAGNADWVIDNNMPYPSPSNPTSETSWIGAISSWAFELHQAGYNVVTLPPDSAITYGTNHPLDLSNFDVYIICEPQDPFTYDERKAIFDFVRNGGGLFLVSDHCGADRNNNGWDATEIYNAMGIGDSMGVHFNSDNESNNDITEDSDNYNNNNSSDTIFHGPYGDITGPLCFHAGSTMKIDTLLGASGEVWDSSYAVGDETGVMMATSYFGKGRIILITDSSPADDGTGNSGNNLYNGWSGEGDDRLFFLNGTVWLTRYGTGGIINNKISEIKNNFAIKILNGIVMENAHINMSIMNPSGKRYKVDLYNIAGKRIANLYIGNYNGNLNVKMSKIIPGIYFIRFNVAGSKSSKVIVIK